MSSIDHQTNDRQTIVTCSIFGSSTPIHTSPCDCLWQVTPTSSGIEKSGTQRDEAVDPKGPRGGCRREVISVTTRTVILEQDILVNLERIPKNEVRIMQTDSKTARFQVAPPGLATLDRQLFHSHDDQRGQWRSRKAGHPCLKVLMEILNFTFLVLSRCSSCAACVSSRA